MKKKMASLCAITHPSLLKDLPSPTHYPLLPRQPANWVVEEKKKVTLLSFPVEAIAFW